MNRDLRNQILAILLLFGLTSKAQVTVQSGTVLTILPGAKLSLDQDMSVLNGGTLDNSGIFSFKGNFTNNGVANFSSGSQLLSNGTMLQRIGGTGVLSFSYLNVNNAAGLALDNGVTIVDSLVLVKGILYSSATAPVHFAPTAKNPIETNNNHIEGVAIMDDRNVGAAVMDAFLGVDMAPGSDAGVVNITRTTGNNAIITADGKKSIATNWTINSTTPTSDRDLRFSWLSAFDNAAFLQAMVLYSNEGGYSKISNISADVSASDPRVFIQNNIGSSNHNFALFDTGYRLQIIDFTATRRRDGIQLNWITGPEFGNKGFVIERSFDGNSFEAIGFTDGKNGGVSNTYTFHDGEIKIFDNRIVYYRLKQVNNDETYQYSETIALSLNSLISFNVYPNPFGDQLKIDIVQQEAGTVNLRLVNVGGSVLFRKAYSLDRTGHIELKGLGNLPAGVYFINIANGKFYETIKLIKYHQ